MKHAESRVIGRRIRELRELRGLTKQDLARAMLINLERLGRVESGKASLDLLEMHKLCELLDTEHTYFATGQFSDKLVGRNVRKLVKMYVDLSWRDQSILLNLAKQLTRDFDAHVVIERKYKEGMEEIDRKLSKRVDNT